jgi:hypothetical protein
LVMSENGRRSGDADVNKLINSRHRQRVEEEGERPIEESWKESERLYNIALRTQNKADHITALRKKVDFYYDMASRTLAEIRRIEMLPVNGTPPRSGGIWTHLSPNGQDDDGPPEAA